MSNLTGNSEDRVRLPGVIALEDGTVLRGRGFGAVKTNVGEIAFHTNLSGYQEILTTPSNAGQIVILTASSIGNSGIVPEDHESKGIFLEGLVIRELSPIYSNWRATMSLEEYMKQQETPGVEQVDTRFLAKHLREQGSMKACISTEPLSDEEAVRRAKAWEGIEHVNYVQRVSTQEIYSWNDREPLHTPFTVPGTSLYPEQLHKKTYKLVAIDLGAKFSLFRKLQYHGFEVTVVPADTSAETILGLHPDALFISSGPGNPAVLTSLHQTVRTLIQHLPTFGICMGHQIIGHALGATSYRLKQGHHGSGSPVRNLETGIVTMTAQNHHFVLDAQSLDPQMVEVTEVNLNDQTVEGLRHRTLPLFSVQYHPEAAPGPNESDPLFHKFYELVEEHSK